MGVHVVDNRSKGRERDKVYIGALNRVATTGDLLESREGLGESRLDRILFR